MSAWMNGENVRELASSGLDEPSSLAIDHFVGERGGRLFWSDAKTGIVESVNCIDSSDRVHMQHPGMRSPQRIDMFENHVYWLSSAAGSVNKVDKFGRGAAIPLVEGLDLAEDLKIFHAYKVPTDGLDNACSNGSCSHLCLLKPNNDFECACPDNSNFLPSDLFTCDAPLEDTLAKPLACDCYHCWCWYNEFGVHTKCHPGTIAHFSSQFLSAIVSIYLRDFC